jgi:hypothetical protein
MRCPNARDTWQVGINFEDRQPNPSVYFLVRWRPPYQFRMINVSDRPWTECTEEDREADEEPRTLFPGAR